LRVLVTGVTGFLGGRVAQAIATRHAVRGFVREPAAWTSRPPAAEIATGSMTDAASIHAAAAGCDAIVHAAALVKSWAKDREDFDRVNVHRPRPAGSPLCSHAGPAASAAASSSSARALMAAPTRAPSPRSRPRLPS